MEKKRKNANRIISITLAFALVVTGLGMGSWGIEGIFAQTQNQDKQIEKSETSKTQSNKQKSEIYTLKQKIKLMKIQLKMKQVHRKGTLKIFILLIAVGTQLSTV